MHILFEENGQVTETRMRHNAWIYSILANARPIKNSFPAQLFAVTMAVESRTKMYEENEHASMCRILYGIQCLSALSFNSFIALTQGHRAVCDVNVFSTQ